MAALKHPRRAEIEALRQLLRQAVPFLREGIKWNAPSYGLVDGGDCLTFRVMPQPHLQIILHRGARAVPEAISFDDPKGMIRWLAPDRGVIDFATVPIVGNEAALADVFGRWIARYSLK